MIGTPRHIIAIAFFLYHTKMPIQFVYEVAWVSLEHLFSGRYMSTQRGSRANLAQVAAPTVAAPSAKQRSWAVLPRSSGHISDGEAKIMNAPTCKTNSMIMMILYVLFTKCRTSRNCLGYLRDVELRDTIHCHIARTSSMTAHTRSNAARRSSAVDVAGC